jgi:hypothetical protein
MVTIPVLGSVSWVTVVAVSGLVGKIVYDLSTANYTDLAQSALTVLGLFGIHLSIPTTPTVATSK